MYYNEKKGKNVKGLSYITSTLKIKSLNDYYEKKQQQQEIPSRFRTLEENTNTMDIFPIHIFSHTHPLFH